ncbi:hypothetical protein PMI34_01893 [Pseudomonas sp. GM74]|uniref:hypothetical protein n=1 Tax=Pseudomonas sp. GM74 TaxID=1144336 RepID=UPI0002707B91|nr:hypothetical protein [Pseudomonas sp. GM74]EJM93088.1 hypothetical protein PMI34_01893 [Pseudomonas sp. GM74]
MTTLISWVSVDHRQPSAIYLASDSRFTWADKTHWNDGKKLYASTKHPEVFGFCGDVLFPAQILDKLCTKIDFEHVLSSDMSFEEKLEIVRAFISYGFTSYPRQAKNIFEILYISRSGSGMRSQFYAGSVSWSGQGDVKAEVLKLPTVSGLIQYSGSGKKPLSNWYQKWKDSAIKDTSRSVFGAFCDSLASGEDPQSGGSPQLMGLYRVGLPKIIGVIWNGEKYISGSPLHAHECPVGIEWHNELFERCDAETLQPKKGAQLQPRPFINK